MRAAGVSEKLMSVLHGQVGEQVKKNRTLSTSIVIDSQAVKNTCNASMESRMFLFLQSHQRH